MVLLELFKQQRMTFERAIEDETWDALTPFLHPQIRYQVMNMPFHCLLDGRDQVIAGMRRSLDGFDRHCEREVGFDTWATEEGDHVISHGKIRFRRGPSPVLESSLWEVATYRDGQIVHLVDLYDVGEAKKFTAWMQQWGAGLDASYA